MEDGSYRKTNSEIANVHSEHDASTGLHGHTTNKQRVSGQYSGDYIDKNSFREENIRILHLVADGTF